MEFLAAENPEISVASVHPGVVETCIFQAIADHDDSMGEKKERGNPQADDGE